MTLNNSNIVSIIIYLRLEAVAAQKVVANLLKIIMYG